MLSSPTISTSPTIPIKIPIVTPKSNDQICQSSFGSNSNWGGTKNDKGGLTCDCNTGYQWNEQRTSCVLNYNKICTDKFGVGYIWYGTINSDGGPDCSSKEENNQICVKDFGVNSIWSGKLNDKGGLTCDCKTGYQWNQGQTQCIIILKAEVKAVTPTTKIVPEVKIIQNKIKKDIAPNISKPDSIILNQEVAPITTTEVKPKSFWSKIKNWLGF